MFDHWSLFVVVLAVFTLTGIGIYLLGNRKTRHEKMKYETYTCGERFESVKVGPENFYSSVEKNLGLKDISRAHSGKVSDYLVWFLIGLVFMVLMVVML